MPPPETDLRYQKAVLWSATGYDEYGQPITSDPIEIRVRWKWKQGLAKDVQGNNVRVDATVVVNQEIAVGSTMWDGELADWYGTGSAGNDDYVMEVLTYNETPDIKNRFIRRTVGLAFYKDTPPGQT